MERRNAEIVRNPLFSFHDETGALKMGPLEPSALISDNTQGEVLWRHSRPKFHDMQLEQLQRIGLNVEYNCEVQEYFEDVASGTSGVILKNGTKHEADLVVAADGARGNSWSLVAGRPVPARSSGSALFRAAYPVDVAMADAEVAERFKLSQGGREITEMWMGQVHNQIRCYEYTLLTLQQTRGSCSDNTYSRHDGMDYQPPGRRMTTMRL